MVIEIAITAVIVVIVIVVETVIKVDI